MKLLVLIISFFAMNLAHSKNIDKDIDDDLSFLFDEKPIRKRVFKKKGNLPSYAKRSNVKKTNSSLKGLILPKNAPKTYLEGVKRGDILPAKIINNIKGYPGGKAPLRAVITGGKFKGAIVTGNLTLNVKTKNITAEFDTLREVKEGQEYLFKGSIQDASGEEGVKGEYVNNRAKGFWASILASFISGYSRGTIRHSKTLLGYEKEPTTDTYLKEGAATASERAAKLYEKDVFDEPVYTIARGPIDVLIFIEKQPFLIKK